MGPKKDTSVQPVTAEGEGNIVAKDDAGSNIEIQPAVVGDEKTLQMAILCLTAIAIVIVGIGARTGAIDAEQVVPPIITAIAGLLGGQALRK